MAGDFIELGVRLDERSGKHGRAQCADIRRFDATHGQLRHVGDDLRRVAAGRRAAAHDEAFDANARVGKLLDVPEQFASQTLRRRRESDAAGSWAKVMPESRPFSLPHPLIPRPAGEKRPEAKSVGAGRCGGQQPIDELHVGMLDGRACSSPNGSTSRR